MRENEKAPLFMAAYRPCDEPECERQVSWQLVLGRLAVLILALIGAWSLLGFVAMVFWSLVARFR